MHFTSAPTPSHPRHAPSPQSPGARDPLLDAVAKQAKCGVGKVGEVLNGLGVQEALQCVCVCVCVNIPLVYHPRTCDGVQQGRVNIRPWRTAGNPPPKSTLYASWLAWGRSQWYSVTAGLMPFFSSSLMTLL